MLRGGQVRHPARQGTRLGVRIARAVLDPEGLRGRAREVSGQIGQGVAHLPRRRKNGVEVIWGEARLLAPGTVEASASDEPAPRRALPPGTCRAAGDDLATGGLPGMLPDGERIWTCFDGLSLEVVPASRLIVGSGAIGVDIAGIHAALGSAVTAVEPAERVLSAEDAEISEVRAKAPGRQGIAVRTGPTGQGVERGGGIVTLLSDGSLVLPGRVLPAAVTHGFAIAVRPGATAEQPEQVAVPHPTSAEALRDAVPAARERAVHA